MHYLKVYAGTDFVLLDANFYSLQRMLCTLNISTSFNEGWQKIGYISLVLKFKGKSTLIVLPMVHLPFV